MTETEMNELRRLAGIRPAELMSKTGTSRENAAAESPVTLPPKAVTARATASEASKPKTPPAPAPDKPATPISAVAMPDPSLAGTSAKVQHIYFDFDQTISKIHVFKQLAGWEPGVRPPHALSERGQIHRLKMLNEAGPVFVYDGHAVQVAQTSSTTASWTACALGGPARVGCLRFLFEELRAAQVKMAVITEGMVGACAYVLEQEGLLHFVEVFGSLKTAHGELEFDRLVLEPSPLEGTEKQHVQSKASLMQQLRWRSDGGVAFVSQTPAEVDSVASPCHGVLVSESREGRLGREGQEAFWVELRQLCGLSLNRDEGVGKAKTKLPEAQADPGTVKPPSLPQGGRFAAANQAAGECTLGVPTTLAKRCVQLFSESQAPRSPLPSSPPSLTAAPSPSRVLRVGPEWGNSCATGFGFGGFGGFGPSHFAAFTPAPREGHEDQEHPDTSGLRKAGRSSSRRHSE
ncbi:unnamed protein product, partial [Symbiodinium sp. CCMP2456]